MFQNLNNLYRHKSKGTNICIAIYVSYSIDHGLYLGLYLILILLLGLLGSEKLQPQLHRFVYQYYFSFHNLKWILTSAQYGDGDQYFYWCIIAKWLQTKAEELSSYPWDGSYIQ